MKKGTVKFFNESKGFGFIIEEDSKNEYFVHISGVIDEIKEGDVVEFELKEGKKGLNAVNVKVIWYLLFNFFSSWEGPVNRAGFFVIYFFNNV